MQEHQKQQTGEHNERLGFAMAFEIRHYLVLSKY